MSGKPLVARGAKFLSWAAGAAILVLSGTLASAQTPPTTGASPAGSSDVQATPADGGNIVQTGCSSCGGGGLPAPDYGFGGGGGCPSCCYAGRKPCDCCWDATTKLGKCCAGVYECLCCPDPCYDPQWLPIADAAFFQDAARPITHMRIRYDGGWGLTHPDRAEYFQARASTTPNQVFPNGTGAGGPGKGPTFIASRVDYDDLILYNEAAVGAFGFFTEFLYRSLEPAVAPISPALGGGRSGFGDMALGTKSMILDCELYQFTFQFKTFLPIGNFTAGLGTGHVSLEPAFLSTLKCTNDCYMQMMWALWIPIAGDSTYQGNVFHEHYSINKVLVRKCKGCVLVGTAEFNHYQVCNGAYTADDILVGGAPVAVDAQATMFTAGPGLRLFICEKIDIGCAGAFAFTPSHFADQLVRVDFRWRF